MNDENVLIIKTIVIGPGQIVIFVSFDAGGLRKVAASTDQDSAAMAAAALAFNQKIHSQT